MKNRFYFSSKQKAVIENKSKYVWVGEGGVGWVEYTELCSSDEAKCNWDDAVLVYETDSFPQTREEVIGKKLRSIRCSYCGAVILESQQMHRIQGYPDKCCSVECLRKSLETDYTVTVYHPSLFD